MRVRVTDASHLRELILFLRECGCVADQAGGDVVEVFIPESRNAEAARLELGVYLDAWCIREDADAVVLD